LSALERVSVKQADGAHPRFVRTRAF